MSIPSLLVHDVTAMRQLGSAVGRAARAGDVLLLDGVFGAGKTTFVQGLAQGLDVRDGVSSPSFVLEHQHLGRLPLYHMDLYRLERLDPALLEELEEHLFGDGVAVVEWPSLLAAALRENAATLHFTIEGDGIRRVALDTAQEHLRQAFQPVRSAC